MQFDSELAEALFTLLSKAVVQGRMVQVFRDRERLQVATMAQDKATLTHPTSWIFQVILLVGLFN